MTVGDELYRRGRIAPRLFFGIAEGTKTASATFVVAC
jgi:hypothetical protein